LSNRARILRCSADGELNRAIAERLKQTKATVGKWRCRFIERRIAGLYDDVRPGKPRTIDDERIAQLIKTTLHTKPADGSTHWSVRTAAAETGISKSSVAATSGSSACSHTALRASSCPTIRSASRSSATWWACT
jgi:putative transposase